MDLENEFKKETGFDAYIDNNLEPKIPMGYYVEWLEEKIEQLELLSVVKSVKEKEETAFSEWLKENKIKIKTTITYKWRNMVIDEGFLIEKYKEATHQL